MSTYAADLANHYDEVRKRLFRPVAPQRSSLQRVAYVPPPLPQASAEPAPDPAPAPTKEAPMRLTLLGCVDITDDIAEWQIPTPRRRHWAEVAEEVAAKHGISVKLIRSPLRVRRFCAARHELVWRLREELDWSWGQIGRLLHRDHTTVLSSWRRHQASIDAWMAN